MVDSIKRGYDEYLLNEIKKYIHQELKTKNFEEIKKELLNAGHEKTAIEKAIEEVKKNNFKISKNKDINNNAEKKLIEAIQHFIKEQRKLNRPIEKIKKVLLDYGHSDELVNKALEEIKEEIPKTYHLPSSDKILKEHIMLTSLVSLILLITITGSILNENIFLVFIAFTPALTTTILTYYNIEKLKEKAYLISFVTTILFFIISLISPILKQMEYENLTILNFIISILITWLFSSSLKTKISEEKIKKRTYW